MGGFSPQSISSMREIARRLVAAGPGGARLEAEHDWTQRPASRGVREVAMHVRDGMNQEVLTIGPNHTLREASRLMARRRVGAAVVVDPDNDGIGILTERDILESVAAGEQPDSELVSAHLTRDLVFAAPHWSLDDAAAAMVRGGFRHLVVLDGSEVVGVLAMRDIVRCWTTAAVGTRS
jgi:CBS domain-containing protein